MSPPAPTPRRSPARIGIVSPQPIVSSGLQALIAQADGDWEVVLGPDGAPPPEVVLYDVMSLHAANGADLDHLVQTGTTVIAVGRDLRPDLQSQALHRGAIGAISIGISAGELVEVVRSALEGRLDESTVLSHHDPGTPLGAEAGLSGRESSVLRLIVQGCSNQEIAERLYLSINSIKTYIRTTYRKIGVSTRQQAVTWAIQHGFPIDPEPSTPAVDLPDEEIGTRVAASPDTSEDD